MLKLYVHRLARLIAWSDSLSLVSERNLLATYKLGGACEHRTGKVSSLNYDHNNSLFNPETWRCQAIYMGAHLSQRS